MSPFDHIKNATHLHHAYVIEGNPSDIAPLLVEALTARGVVISKNPDVFIALYTRLLVGDARAVVEFASLAPLSEKKYIILSIGGATEEAQSALLKAVEEASGHSIFFFLIAHGTSLLPTILSRCVVLKSDTNESEEDEEGEGRAFLTLSYKDRMLFIEKLAKAHDRERARRVVSALLTLHQTAPFSKEVLADLLEAHAFLGLSGSSIKVALGHVALMLESK